MHKKKVKNKSRSREQTYCEQQKDKIMCEGESGWGEREYFVNEKFKRSTNSVLKKKISERLQNWWFLSAAKGGQGD